MTFNIKEELKKLPDQPGVYIMHDAGDAIIYVGKAVSLRNREKRQGPLKDPCLLIIDYFCFLPVLPQLFCKALHLHCVWILPGQTAAQSE